MGTADDRPPRRALATGGLLCLLLAFEPAAADLTLATEGEARLRVVLPRETIPAERTAARELADYLGRVTGARFATVIEGDDLAEGPAIFVGPTAAARRSGVEPSGPEEWRIRATDGGLLLTGGRPRGTLYAVYRFLEDVVGVRWWTPYAESVPSRPTLALPPLDRGGSPGFGYRDLDQLDGPPEFSARNRHSGDRSLLDWSYGGRQAYGPPSAVHNFYLYVPPAEEFAAHPEYFSWRNGVRTAERAQLCLTDRGLRNLIVERMAGHIERSRAEAASRGEPPPRLFAISQNDWGGACTCDRCAALDRREATHAGSLVDFLNDVAGRIGERYPDVLLDTLAYHYTIEPPRQARLRDNVVVRLASLQRRDFSRPITHRANRPYRAALDGWRRATRHLRIWDYAVTFGRRAELPLPNLPVIAHNVRHYLEHGVEGVFVQLGPPVPCDLRDLKVWALLKLLEQPEREIDGLIREFTDGFYGPAGATIRAYLAELERAQARRPGPIEYPAEPRQYRFLDARFLRRAHELFDRAERQTASDAELLQRVRFARVGLDRATLHRWRRGLGRPSAAGPALDPEEIAERYWSTAWVEIDRRLPEPERDRVRRRIQREIGRAMERIGYVLPQAAHD